MTFFYVLLAVVGGFFALMVGMRLWIQYKVSALKGKAAPELGGRPGKIVKKGKPALFYFYSPSCGACAGMTPAVKQLSKKREEVFPVDISSDMATARKFGIMATPTLVVIRDRVIQEILVGPQPIATLEGHLG